MKRWLSGVLSVAMLFLLSSTARAAITSCALDGLYAASSAVDAYPTDQAQMLFTFTPPTTCSNGASGTVSISGTLLEMNNPSQIPVSWIDAPYVVDEIGHLTVVLSDSILIDGQIGLLTDTTAHGFVFVAAESTVPNIRFSGVAVKQTLAPGPTGPTGPQGSQGPQGATGARRDRQASPEPLAPRGPRARKAPRVPLARPVRWG
jgi:hypothetical protein